MMDTRRYLWLTCWLLVFGLGACEGGSGSSGFDVRSENAAIQEALVEQHCVQHESLTICPAAETGATPSPTSPSPAASSPTPTSALPGPTTTPSNAVTPAGVPTATASPASSAAASPTPSRAPASTTTPTSTAARTATVPRSATATATATVTSSAQRVDIGIDPHVPVVCVSAQGGSCAFVLPFAANGFPPTAIFRVAIRTVNSNGRWVIGDALTPSGPATPTFEVPVDIGAPVSSCCGTTVQAAILAFLTPPVSVPAAVDELVDSGADAAFVTEPFTVQTS
jgi:hypothetical protein